MVQSAIARIAGWPAFWALAMAILFGGPLVSGLRRSHPPPPPPVLGIAREFSAVDEHGVMQSLTSLRGHALILDIGCVRCVNRRDAFDAMRHLQRRTRNLGDAVLLLSVAEDADAQQLGAVRRALGAGPRWHLLAGAVPGIAPADTLVLLDDRSRIRGNYRAARAEDLDRLVADVAVLAALR
jgi:hypothetical protein